MSSRHHPIFRFHVTFDRNPVAYDLAHFHPHLANVSITDEEELG